MRRLLVALLLLCAVGCLESPTAPELDGCTSVVQPDGSIETGCPGG